MNRSSKQRHAARRRNLAYRIVRDVRLRGRQAAAGYIGRLVQMGQESRDNAAIAIDHARAIAVGTKSAA